MVSRRTFSLDFSCNKPKELGEHGLVVAGRARCTFLSDAEKGLE